VKCLVVHTTAHQNTVHQKERKKEKRDMPKRSPVSIIMYAVLDSLDDGKLTMERGNGHLDNGHASNMGNIDH
jgi:hypothetical protein